MRDLRSRLARLAPLAAASLLALSTPVSAGQAWGYHGMPYGHPPCHGTGMSGKPHGLHGAPGRMYAPGHHGMHGMYHAPGGYGAGHGQYGKGKATAAGDLIDTAVAAGSFTTLAKAIEAAGLTDTLRGEGPFTVFAPTDAAFAKLPKDKLDALMVDKEKLTAVLTYHVVPGRLSAADLLERGEAKTVQGQTLSVTALDVAKADIASRNGIIHIIDTVLLPSM